MRHLPAVLLLLALSLAVAPARADFEQSRVWFESLTAEERSETQANLTLLGHYTFLVDGQFGRGTYQALTDFQRSQGRAETGALIPRDREKLVELAATVSARLGMEPVRDREGRSELVVPLRLLTVFERGARGNSYATPDNGVALHTMRRSIGEISFKALFDELNAPAANRSISYSSYNDGRFVVSGRQDGRDFYTLFQSAESESVGYSVSWTEANADTAAMLAIFIASHFSVLRDVPADGGALKIAETPSGVRRFGVFMLPPNAPDVIVMNGEVTYTLAADFFSALEARPEARTVVLNSPGGSVNNALQVAHEVRRRGMSTLVGQGMGCYSACAYIFFAGSPRFAEGELGVHQISAEVADLVLAQTTLADVLDALDQFDVRQPIITVMLQTPPEDMHVFSATEIADLGINIGEPVRVADLSTITTLTNAPADPSQVAPVSDPRPARPAVGGAAYVQLAMQSSEAEAQRSLQFARERWAGVLGDAVPEISREESARGVVFRIRVAVRSAENANALCAAIKSAGGGCYVTTS